MNPTADSQRGQTSETVATRQSESSAAPRRSFLSVNTLLRLLIVAVGMGLVVASLFQNWFDIPTAKSLAQSFDDIVRQTPACQFWFKAIIATGTLLLCWLRFSINNGSSARCWFAHFCLYRLHFHTSSC